MEKACWVPFDILEKFMIDVFQKVGIPEEDARVCADVLKPQIGRAHV